MTSARGSIRTQCAAHGPAIERARMARFAAAVGTVTGSDAERHGNIVGTGQLDSIDTSRNTTGYPAAPAERGLLHWHGDGTPWAIDSRFLDNGLQSHVRRSDVRLARGPLPSNSDAS